MNKLSGPQKLIDALASVEEEPKSTRPEKERPAKREFKPKDHKPKSSAYQYSMFLLGGQDYSEFKLRKKLKSKGYEETEINEALTKLIEKNYLREEEYKKLLARKLIRKGKADGMIRRQIEQEKLQIDAAQMTEIREEMGMSKEDTLSQLILKKTRGKAWPKDFAEKRKAQEKVYRYLLSRGYSYDDAKKAMNLTQLDE